MAALEFSLISFLMPFFVFLIILVVIYAILMKTNLFGEKATTLNLIAAVSIAAVATFAGSIITPLTTIIPWIVFIGIILLFLFAILGFFGAKEEEIWGTIGGKSTIVVIIIIIVFIGLVMLFEPEVSPFGTLEDSQQADKSAGEENVQSEVVKTLTHPRVLGALFILIVASFAIRLIIDKLE